MKKYVCLRDDDTNFFTTLEELKNGYGEFWGKLPITLATIPFAHGSERKILDYDLDDDKFEKLRMWQKNASVEELTEFHKVFPIGDNKALIGALKNVIKDNKVEIAQHGVFHRYNERGAELYVDEMAYAAIRDGKEYLEKVFSAPVNTFIPPGNTIDEGCLKYVKNLNMNLFCSGSVKCKSIGDKIMSYLKDPLSAGEKVKNKLLENELPIYRRLGIYIFWSVTYNIFNKESNILDRVVLSLEKTGFAALGTHYRLLADADYRAHYHHVLTELSDRGDVEFVTANKYYHLMMERFYG